MNYLRKTKNCLFSLLPFCMLLMAANVSAEENEALKRKSKVVRSIHTLIEKDLPKGSNVAIKVYDLTDNKPFYDYQSDKLSRPASTMKLLTAITTLSREDRDVPFRTEVWYQGDIKQDTLQGDLYVVGGFDPEFTEVALDSLVKTVANSSFHVLQGNVYGDVSMKDSLYFGSGWIWDDAPYYYQPCLSPLMLEKGVLKVVATPTEKGQPAALQCLPRSTYYSLTNNTASWTDSLDNYDITRNWLDNGNEVVVSGNVKRRSSATVTIHSSQDFFMHTFVEHLKEQHIEILAADSVIHAPMYSFKELPEEENVHQLAVYETPVKDVINQLLKESDNLNGEALLCRLGSLAAAKKHVSANDGLDAINALMKELGLDPDDYSISDGCGLSSYNRLSPELQVAFLKYAYDHQEWFKELYDALPISGIDGTLKYRMGKDNAAFKKVHAKTGTISGISCLAGYVTAKNGHMLAFSIMNQNFISARKARSFQDKVCTVLAE